MCNRGKEGLSRENSCAMPLSKIEKKRARQSLYLTDSDLSFF